MTPSQLHRDSKGPERPRRHQIRSSLLSVAQQVRLCGGGLSAGGGFAAASIDAAVTGAARAAAVRHHAT